MKKKRDIELVSTKRLIRELLNRFDVAVFAGLRYGEIDPDSTTLVADWVGLPHTVAGLCQDVGDSAIQKFRGACRPRE